MLKPIRKVYDWAASKANTPLAPLWLGVVFLLELFVFVPLDALLMLFCMENPKRRFLYAMIGSVASTISGIGGYLIGYLLWDSIGPFVIQHLISESFFNRLVDHYNSYQGLAVLVGSFLPIPFKAVALSAGFCHVSLLPFIGFVFLARVARFFLVAKLMHLWGPQIKAFLDRHFNRIVVAVGAKIALTLTFFWVLGH
jgi:membrane protein YqaA with SNARE-associated domain